MCIDVIGFLQGINGFIGCSIALSRGSQVLVVVNLEREDEAEGSPHVIAPFFPQVSTQRNTFSMVAQYTFGFSV